MRAAQIQDGKVVNFILVDAFTDSWIDPQNAQIGDFWDGEKFSVAEITADKHNAPILALLAEIDEKSIRPLRDGEVDRLAQLREQAAALRAQLRK